MNFVLLLFLCIFWHPLAEASRILFVLTPEEPFSKRNRTCQVPRTSSPAKTAPASSQRIRRSLPELAAAGRGAATRECRPEPVAQETKPLSLPPLRPSSYFRDSNQSLAEPWFGDKRQRDGLSLGIF